MGAFLYTRLNKIDPKIIDNAEITKTLRQDIPAVENKMMNVMKIEKLSADSSIP